MGIKKKVIVERMIGGRRQEDTEDAYEVIEAHNTICVAVGEDITAERLHELVHKPALDLIIKRNRHTL
tara:strand:+ start:699 stop:902 length:204 start_codon:yes stop_codon:yes gene_type:complete